MSEQRKYCKEKVFDNFAFRGRQCARYAKEDGYCHQHHPKTVEARQKASEAEYDMKWRMKVHQRRTSGSGDFVEWVTKVHDPELGKVLEELRQEWLKTF